MSVSPGFGVINLWQIHERKFIGGSLRICFFTNPGAPPARSRVLQMDEILVSGGGLECHYASKNGLIADPLRLIVKPEQARCQSAIARGLF